MDDCDAWTREVLALSDIPQDDDDAIEPDEAERRFNHFVELVDEVRGDEGDEVFVTLLETLREQEDYGAYQAVYGAMSRFAPERRGRLVAEGIAALIERSSEQAGDVLGQLTFDGPPATTAWLGSDDQQGVLRV